MTPAEVLAGARDVLAERGWFQGAFCEEVYPEDVGAVCAWGAIHVAAMGSPRPFRSSSESFKAVRFLERVIPTGNLPLWNDDDDTTYEDVVLALKQAEELALEAEA